MVWCLLLGFALGVLATCIGILRLKVGTLKVYIPNDRGEAPYVYPEFYKGADFICRRKCVLFMTAVEPLNSQE